MRSLVAASVLAATALLSAVSLADVGPPPSCPSGEHREYRYGHHCVKDGFHLDDNGKEVSDTPVPRASVAPTAEPSASTGTTPAASSTSAATASGSTTATPDRTGSSSPASQPPASTPPKRGCACELGPTTGGLGAAALGFALVAAFGARRRARTSRG